MLTCKTFVKKTKKGNILKVVREHYLRDDLWCGSSICKKCDQREEDIILEEAPDSQSSLCIFPHYLVLDTNVILDQIDLLEEDAFKSIIILSTVLEEVRHKSSPVFKRIKDVIANPARRFYTFVNEHHKETYIEQEPRETANDRNDRAIRRACTWYESHLAVSQENRGKSKRTHIVLLTDDARNKEQAEKEGLFVYTVREYVQSMKDHATLEDKMSKRSFLSGGGARALFPEHLSPGQIHAGIKLEKYHQGTFYLSRENYLEATVSTSTVDNMVLIQGHANLNRAVDGDTVAVELFSQEMWSAPSEVVLEDEGYDPGDTVEDDENELRKSSRKMAAEKRPTGRVVGIIRRKWRQYCGILQPNPVKGSNRHIFVPAERKIPKIRIETRQAETLCKQRIIVAIDSWPRNSRYPMGHFVRALGNIGDKDTENEVLLLEHDVPHSSFSEAVNACLPKMPWIITEEDEKKRTDLRHLNICSVDPPGCTDIDDALHCTELPNGNYEVGVHIADVSHFIRPGTAIDREAANRCTTVYLIDKRIDMVPDLLSSNLCSLRGGEERFAFSCIWELSPEAKIISTYFCKSIIRSRAALTYAEAQAQIDDQWLHDDLAVSLRGLNKLAKILKKQRIDNGALVLASPEIRFQVDSETHDPIDVIAKQLMDTNSMVEEFMLLANISSAKKILEDFPECALLRRHPSPPLPNFDPLIKAGRTQGFDINIDTGKALADSLESAVNPDNPYFNTMLRIIATRCMMQAVYFCTGNLQESEYFHYGLACPIYTHFTSPIRRYADVIVHRLLAVSIGADMTYADLLNKTVTQNICNQINYRHRMAQYAGRASVALHTHIFFRERIQDEQAYVLFVRQNALQILIPKYGLEGTIYLSSPKEKKKPTDVKFIFNEEEPSQTCGDIKLRTFDPVIVQLCLDRTNIQHQKLVVKLVKPEIAGFSVPPVSSDKERSEQPISIPEETTTEVDSTPVQTTKLADGAKKRPEASEMSQPLRKKKKKKRK